MSLLKKYLLEPKCRDTKVRPCGRYVLFGRNCCDSSTTNRLINLKRRVLHLAGTKNSNRTDRICFWRDVKIFAEIKFRQKRIISFSCSSYFVSESYLTITQISFLTIVLVEEHQLLAKTFRPFWGPAKCKTRCFRYISLIFHFCLLVLGVTIDCCTNSTQGVE